jgi:hypothetical protein
MKVLEQEIAVSNNTFQMTWFNSAGVGGPRKNLDNRWWMVSRHNQDRVSWNDGSLDWSQGWKMENEGCGYRI